MSSIIALNTGHVKKYGTSAGILLSQIEYWHARTKYTDDENRAIVIINYADLAAQTGLSLNAVKRAVEKLVKAGVIASVVKFMGKTKRVVIRVLLGKSKDPKQDFTTDDEATKSLEQVFSKSPEQDFTPSTKNPKQGDLIYKTINNKNNKNKGHENIPPPAHTPEPIAHAGQATPSDFILSDSFMEFWGRAKNQLELQYSADPWAFNAWIEPLVYLGRDPKTREHVFRASDQNAANMCSQRLGRRIRRVFSDAAGEDIGLRFEAGL
jgi:hypothetical protein